jgi:pantetheine-phosphate adenylyltransferase
VILLLANNPTKKSAFSVEERLTMMKDAVKDLDNVQVDYTDGLTVDYAKNHHAVALIRGLRAVTDFEYEFQLAAANHFANPDIEMVFFMANEGTTFISSSTINQLFHNGVDITPLSSLKRSPKPTRRDGRNRIGKHLTRGFRGFSFPSGGRIFPWSRIKMKTLPP